MESPRFFQIPSKTRQGIPEILKGYFKNKAQGVPEILSNYFKNKTQDGPEIISNYVLQKQTMDPRDFFKLL